MSENKKYSVNVAYEESFSVVVESSSQHDAEDKVISLVDQYGCNIKGANPIHRDCFISHIEEENNE